MKLFVAALPALFLAGAVSAQTLSPTGAPGAAPADQAAPTGGRGETAQTEDPAERQICRLVEASESRRRTRVCMTARQWRENADRLD